MKIISLIFLDALCLLTSFAYSQERVIFGQNEIKLILNAHNTERRLVGVSDLVWDAGIAEYAYEWALKLAREDDGLEHRPPFGRIYGENLSYFLGYSFTANRGVDMWNDEKADYSYSTVGSSQRGVVGHFTQVIWANTSKVGCGCAKSANGGYYFVCNYNPPGNYIGQYPYPLQNQLKNAPISTAPDQQAENLAKPKPDEIPYLKIAGKEKNIYTQPKQVNENVVKPVASEGSTVKKEKPVSTPINYANRKETKPVTAKVPDVKKEKKRKAFNSQVLTLKAGGYINYSIADISILPNSFDSRILSGHGTAMLGYRYGNANRKSAFGIFGTYGMYSSEASSLFVSGLLDNTQLSFYEVEAGFIFNEWLRLSGGKGITTLGNINDDLGDYICGTLGLSFGPRNFKFELNNTVIFPSDENQIRWRPSIGLALKLDLFKRY